MRVLPGVAGVFAAAALLVACDGATPTQPSISRQAAGLGKPEIDPTYANGTTVYMIGPHAVPGAAQTMPNLYAHAEELYLVVFPQQTLPVQGQAGAITLPSGYMPQCNPCWHPGLPAQSVYHDHVITGAPGMGNNGTAGVYLGPWKIIVLLYNPAYAASPTFRPLKSEADIDNAEQQGASILLPFNQGAANPYELDTGNLLICPTVSPHA